MSTAITAHSKSDTGVVAKGGSLEGGVGGGREEDRDSGKLTGSEALRKARIVLPEMHLLMMGLHFN